MRAWQIQELHDLDEERQPLTQVETAIPEPGSGELLLKVHACGVCHTELDEIEGRAPPPSLPVIPGHQVVATVAALGSGCSRFSTGDRVGVGWIHHSDGSDSENLSDAFIATGRDVDGGYAEYMRVPEDYACHIPDALSDTEAAPLLCAGAIGYRALRLCGIKDGDVLGLTGFGGSGHIVLQLARHQFPKSPVFVFARSASERELAMELGAAWSGSTADAPPRPCRSIIDTTPAWLPVLKAMENLQPGGRLVINAIRKSPADRQLMAEINYEQHLWQEKEIKSVANICFSDIEEFLPLAASIPIRPTVETFDFERANDAVLSLHDGNVRGAKVLLI